MISQYDWMYNNNYWYWLGTPYTDSTSDVWYVHSDGNLSGIDVGSSHGGVVRPVITISKSNLSSAGNQTVGLNTLANFERGIE